MKLFDTCLIWVNFIMKKNDNIMTDYINVSLCANSQTIPRPTN